MEEVKEETAEEVGDGGCKGKEEKYEGNRNGRKRTTEQGRQRVGKERKKVKRRYMN